MIKLNRPLCPHPQSLENKNYKNPLNKEALKKACNDKCMYCESKISHNGYAHIEHIKPKAIDKFPDLEFDWNNLGYSCHKCNNEKLDKFFSDFEFINPYNEEPSIHIFAFGSMVFHKRGSERGEITIKEIALNRPELLERRGRRISDVKKTLDACYRTKSKELKELAINELRNESNADKEYSFFIKALLTANEL